MQSKRDMESLFVNGRLPRLLYANRQDYEEALTARPIHSHESVCELLLCHSGTGIYNIGNERYEVSEGDLIFYNAGEMHEIVSLSTSRIGTYCLGYTDLQIKGLARNHTIEAGLPFVRHAGRQYIFLRELAEQILERMRSPEQEEAFIVQMMATTFLLLARRVPVSERASRVTENALEISARIKSYIEAHYREPICLQDIAQALDFSPSYLSHLFKDTTGYAPIEYVIRCRIGYAQTMLISGDQPVSVIASEAGFDNVAHFQTLFKKIVGTTPRRYRVQYLSALYGGRNQR